jgi:MFS family permease
MFAGLVLMGVCVAISAFVGQHFVHYVAALVLLGMGWNFLFVAGTTLLTTSYAPSERYRAQGLNDFVVFGTQAAASLAAGPAVMRLGWPSLNLMSVPLLALMAAAVVWLGWSARSTSPAAAAP